MQLGMLLGVIVVAAVDVLRSRFHVAYGCDGKDSPEYVVAIAALLLCLFYAFPEWG